MIFKIAKRSFSGTEGVNPLPVVPGGKGTNAAV